MVTCSSALSSFPPLLCPLLSKENIGVFGWRHTASNPLHSRPFEEEGLMDGRSDSVRFSASSERTGGSGITNGGTVPGTLEAATLCETCLEAALSGTSLADPSRWVAC